MNLNNMSNTIVRRYNSAHFQTSTTFENYEKNEFFFSKRDNDYDNSNFKNRNMNFDAQNFITRQQLTNHENDNYDNSNFRNQNVNFVTQNVISSIVSKKTKISVNVKFKNNCQKSKKN